MHNTSTPRRLTLLVLAAIASPAWAGDDSYALEEVVVSGQRMAEALPEAATLTSEQIATLKPATSDTASLLRDVPGVSLYGAGGVSSLPVVHGLADDRLRTLVDGADTISTCPNHMNPALSYIDPSQVADAKVYAGVTPVSVGGDSTGGTVVVNSAAPEFASAGSGLLTKGELGAFYRSNGHASGANAAVTLAGENLSIRYSGATAKSDNYKAGGDFKDYLFTGRIGHTLPYDEVGSTAYKSIDQSLDIALRGGAHLLDLKLSRQHIPYENFANQRMDLTGNDSDKVNLSYTGLFGWGTLKARVYHEETEHAMDFGADKRFWYGSASGGSTATDGTPCSPIGSTCAAGMPMNAESRTNGLALSAELPVSENDVVRIGSELQFYRLDDWWPPSGGGMWPGTFWNINNGTRDRYALFGEWEAKLDERWTTLLGVRHEIVKADTDDVEGYCTVAPCGGSQLTDSAAFNALDRKRTDHNWDLTGLARYTPDATHSYEIGLAQKTRSPNLYELYPWSTWTMAAVMNNFVGDGNGYVGNPDLDPEVAHTVSFAADWHDAGNRAWGVRIAPYYTHVRDYIDAQCRPGTTCTAGKFNVLQYVNQTARLYGVDLSGHARVAQDTGYGDFTLSGLVNYVRGKNTDTDDGLYNVMPLNAKLALTQNLGRWTGTLEAQFVAGKHDVSAARNEIETGGYSLFNLRGSYQWQHLRLDVGVDNLFDRYYDLPLGGAYVGQGTTMAINPPVGNYPQWGTAVPGPGRSLYVGLSARF
ncbi:TonB-dependent receptor [Parasulfuritortus cantonensis]|uniref:TonB-dependent receptor n=1 Tax=Parasulfuritortus cantonensis TaxID=2528202 RepID=A0A4R1BDF2_9PROT|nr:TonB-dependent receptor [Parasulfuritortus cantonensis]TCJ15100.1 TonB-dependent receptor [Parasulfuritortus cantonensis]